MNTLNKVFVVVVLFFASSKLGWACFHPPQTTMVPEVVMVNGGINPTTGKSDMWFGVEVDPVLFSITQPTVCTCGIGIGGVGLPFIPSLNVTSAMIAVTNTLTLAKNPLAEFNFSADASVAADAAANAIVANQQWAGFSALVDNVVQPVLGPSEDLKLWFQLEVDANDVALLTDATLGRRLGFSVGGNNQNTTHPPLQFTGIKVPEPSLITMFAIGLIFLLRRKVIEPED